MRLKRLVLPLFLALGEFGLAPAQTITGYLPTSVPAGSPSFNLNLTGINFCGYSQVFWNSTVLATRYTSSTSMSAAVPANLVSQAATVSVSVVNSTYGCVTAATGPPVSFVVSAGVSTPPGSAISIQPPLLRTSAPAGSPTPIVNTVNVRNADGTPQTAPLTATVLTISGGINWLATMPQTQNDLKNGVLRFTANPTGLAPGSYLGYIVYGQNAGSVVNGVKPRAAGTLCSQVSTAVVFTVGNPALTFSPLNPVIPANPVENTINVTVNSVSGQSAGQTASIPMQITATTDDGAGAPCWLSIAPLNVQLETGMPFQATASSASLPAGAHIGALTAQAAGETASDAIVFQNAGPGQQYLDLGTNPVITIDPNTLTGSIPLASAPAIPPLAYFAACNGCAGAVLSTSAQTNGLTPATLSVTITDLSLFNPGRASVTVSSPMAASVTLPIVLGPLMLVSDGIATSGQTRLKVPGNGEQGTVTVASGCPWLAASADGSITPFEVNLSVNPAGLAAGSYTCSLQVTTSVGSATVPVTLNLEAATATQAVIPQIADGANWTTTITLVNLDSGPSPAFWKLSFYGNTGNPLNLAWTDQTVPTNSRSGTLQPGGSQTLQTTGASALLATGWAQLTSQNRIGGNAIFAWNGQEAAVPILRTTQPTQYFPFDNNTGLMPLGVAVAAPAGSSPAEMATLSMRNQNGVALTLPQQVQLTPSGQTNFNLPVVSTATPDLRGVLELDTSNDPEFGLGIRARTIGNTFAFTSIEALYTQPDTVQTISHIADGATWKTTIVLVNTGSVPAAYSVHFWRDDGTAFMLPVVGGTPANSLGGTIAVGGTATIESTGAAGALTTGWAEVLSGQSVSGTAIFQWQMNGQEAAVPFLSAGGNHLVFPFDTTNNRALGIALANPDLNAGVSVTMTIRDTMGIQLGGTSSIAVPVHGHYAFNPTTLPANQQGTIEFDSPNLPIYGLGIRFNGSAFTSIRGLPK